jgi:putative intracellular protease/amidase
MKSTKVLFIATSHAKVADSNDETGVWLEELAAPYYIFKEAGLTLRLHFPLEAEVLLIPKANLSFSPHSLQSDF